VPYNLLAREELTEEQLNLCGHQVLHLNGTVPYNLLARKKLTEEQLNLSRDIRYAILMGQCHITCWPGRS
jgi:hypothetical protein